MLRLVSTTTTRHGIRRFTSSHINSPVHQARLAERGTISKEQRAVLRATRKEQAAQVLEKEVGAGEAAAVGTSSKKAVSSGSSISGSTVRWMWYAGAGVPTLLLAWGIYDNESPPGMFAEMIGLTGLIRSSTQKFTDPISNKLIPDWSQMPNVPQDIPLPHTLVLDLEDTLVNSSWDRKHGWRHAKRPGVDKFLTTMAQYYEIVLYSPSIDGIAIPVVDNLDKNGCIMHRLFRESTLFKNGKYYKDLKSLNRPINRMVVLDDDPDAYDGDDKNNVIVLKPYSDPSDREDRTLERITPLLLEIAKENYSNIPIMLRQFQGMNADQIADEYQRRIDTLRHNREVQTSHGLGSFAVKTKRNRPTPELSPVTEGVQTPSAAAGLTAKDIAGPAPPTAGENDARDGVAGWFKRRQKENEEDQMRKMEKWNAHLQKKHEEKMKREQELVGSGSRT